MERKQLLKNFTRISITALALAALLGLTACGSSKPADQPAPAQSQSQDSNKPEVWSDHLDASLGLPADWNESAGWKTSIGSNSLVSFGDYLAYLDTAKNKGIVVDGKGDKKFSTGDSNELDGSTTAAIKVVSKDGKKYLVSTESGTSKVDASSVKKASTKTVIHVFDTGMKEIWTKSFPGIVSVQNDAIVVSAPAGTPTQSIVDLETGDLKVLTPPAGYDWAGRFDGVDLYSLKVPTADGGELTNGVWKYKTSAVMGTVSVPAAFGNVISVQRPATSSAPGQACDLLDPKTGTVLETGSLSGMCLKATLSSPDGNYVYFVGGKSSNGGIISLSGKRVFPITDDISFLPTSVNNDGLVYGKSGSDVAVFDFNKDTEPKKAQNVSQTPIMVAKNGIAAFESGLFAIKK